MGALQWDTHLLEPEQSAISLGREAWGKSCMPEAMRLGSGFEHGAPRCLIFFFIVVKGGQLFLIEGTGQRVVCSGPWGGSW